MKCRVMISTALVLLITYPGVLAQDPADDPFDGGFSINYQAEVFSLGAQGDSLHGWSFDWLSGADSLVLIGTGAMPESYQCGEDRDMAAADFNGDFTDDVVMAWNRSDGGIFVGIPTIDPATMQPDPAGWHVPSPAIAPGVSYASDTLDGILGEIRLVAGNLYSDQAREFVLAYLAADSTVHLSVFDVDTATLIPVEMATISDQAIHTDMPEVQRFGTASRFDVTTGDFDGDGLDEIALVASDPGGSPTTELMVNVYDYDTTGHTLSRILHSAYAANSKSPGVTCLRRVAATAGDFDADSLAEISFIDDWASADEDTLHYANLHVLDLSADMTSIVDSWDSDSLGWAHLDPLAGLDGVRALTVCKGDLIAGGNFTTTTDGSTPLNFIARWDGLAWRPLGSGMSFIVEALTVYDGDLIAGGAFWMAGDSSANGIARWDGANWHPLGTGVGGGSPFNPYVRALTVYDGELIAGGDFSTAGGVQAYLVARWDGSDWHPLGAGMAGGVTVAPWVDALTTYNGDLIAGGNFTSAGDSAASMIARWDGSDWHPLGAGLGGGGPDYPWVDALTTYNGDLIAGGRFRTAGGISAGRIARWNGTVWDSLGSGIDVDYAQGLGVLALAEYDNKLIVGGIYRKTGIGYNIASWDGVVWDSLSSGTDMGVLDLNTYQDELLAGGTFTAAGGVSILGVARWDGTAWDSLQTRCDFIVDVIASDVDFAPDSADELVVRAYNDPSLGPEPQHTISVFGVDPSDFTACYRAGSYVADGVWGNAPIYGSRRTMGLGDIDGYNAAAGDTLARELLLLVNSSQATRMLAWKLLPDSLIPCDSTGSGAPILKASWSDPSCTPTELVVADLDSLTVTVGPPRAYHIDSVVQPLAIVNAPPVHYDLLRDTIWDVSSRYEPSPPPARETYVAYTNSTGFTVTTETQMHRDWGVSRSLESWAQVGGFSVKGHLQEEYGEGFSKKEGYSEQVTIGATITARGDDQLHVVRASHDVLEYPVLRGGELMGRIAVVSPSLTQQGWSPCKAADDVMPNHEVENIFSYPSPADILTNSMMESDVIGDAAEYFTMQDGSESQWFLGQTKFVESSVEESWNASNTAGVSASFEAGFSIFGFGVKFGARASVQSSYAQGEVSTFSTSFADSDSLHVTLGQINSVGSFAQNRKYEVTPYAYWAKNGALVIDYAVRPSTDPDPGEETWWQLNYSDPDPALILPWRLQIEKGDTTMPVDFRYKTKEVVFVPGIAAPGDSVRIIVRVHNYSLVPTPGPVAVSFYLGNPDNGGTRLTDMISSESVFYTQDTLGTPTSIAAQGWAVAEMTWLVPGSGGVSRCQRIWALVDPLDMISPEVHDNDDPVTNNKGWNLLYVNTSDVCIDSDGDGYGDPAFQCHSCLNDTLDNCPTIPNPGQGDTDGDGVGDACEHLACPVANTGDVNSSGTMTSADIIHMVNFVFKAGPDPLPCIGAGDVDCSGSISPADIIYMVNKVFKLGPEPCDVCGIIPSVWACP